MAKRAYIYGIYDHRDGICKIGHSADPAKRMSAFQPSARPLELVFAVPVPREKRVSVERLAHEQLRDHRAPQSGVRKRGGSEWFRLTLNEAIEAGAQVERIING